MMSAEKRWFWWAGLDGEVECEGLYRFGEFETRDEALSAGREAMPDVDGNTFFHVVEAQFADKLAGGDDDPDDFQPFAAMRNHELIEQEAANG